MTLDTSNKSYAQRAHAKKRAMERYGLDYTRAVRFDLLNIVDSGRIAIQQRQSHRISIMILRYQEQPFRIVFDYKRREIVSFLPLNDERDDKEIESCASDSI